MVEEGVDGLMWENSGIMVSILSSGALIAASTFRVLVLDQESATLELTGASIQSSLILDLRSTVTRQVFSSSEGLLHYKFFYDRLDCHAEIDFILCGPDEHRDTISQNLEFILRQYTLYTTEEDTLSEERRRPNVVAMGFEGVGVGFRTALRSGGRSTGHAIRYLGKMYTSSTIGDSVDREKKVTDQSQIREAEGHQARAETCHAGARTLTSAALAPVRWIGKSASKLAPKTSSSDHGVTRVVHDTIGGMGNGVANVCKGVTEALSEIGGAVGDATMHHSTAKNGEEYADKVTKVYVRAAGEIGLAGYKIGNIASFGVAGLMLDAVVEGATFLISLYEYLVGPVLLQGYMHMTMAPSTVPVMYFVVLRPWSISFYAKSSDFTGKPSMIIACCMLDSLPMLRIRGQSHVTAGPTGNGTASAASEDVAPNTVDNTDKIHGGKAGYVQRMKGGNVSHIELCTVDCSSYLLYPESTQLDLWHKHLLAAALRVETIEKRKSGACELGMLKRLDLLPKSVAVKVQLKRLVVSPATMGAEELDFRRGKSLQAIPLAVKLPADLTDSLPTAVPVTLPVPVTPNQVCDVELPGGHVPQSENIKKPSWSDSMRNMAIVSAYVRIQSVTRQGIVVKSEEVLSSHSKLKRNTSQPAALRPPSPPISTAKSTGTSSLPLPVFHSDGGSAVDSSPDVNSWSLVADWDESEISASPLLNTFDIGRLACLDSGDCDRLCVTVRVAVVGGKTLELGRGYIYLSDIADDNQSDVQDPGMLIERMREKSVNIYTKGSDYLVAILQLSAVFHSIEQPDTID